MCITGNVMKDLYIIKCAITLSYTTEQRLWTDNETTKSDQMVMC